MGKITQRELIARYLAARPTQWIAGHELVKNLKEGIIVQDADTRAYELVKEGFVSEKYQYAFEHKKQGKYAYFKLKEKSPKLSMLEWFNQLKGPEFKLI